MNLTEPVNRISTVNPNSFAAVNTNYTSLNVLTGDFWNNPVEGVQILQAFPVAAEVQLTDAGGNPLSGYGLSFTSPASGLRW